MFVVSQMKKARTGRALAKTCTNYFSPLTLRRCTSIFAFVATQNGGFPGFFRAIKGGQLCLVLLLLVLLGRRDHALLNHPLAETYNAVLVVWLNIGGIGPSLGCSHWVIPGPLKGFLALLRRLIPVASGWAVVVLGAVLSIVVPPYTLHTGIEALHAHPCRLLVRVDNGVIVITPVATPARFRPAV
jgi:hypothetical protein